MLFRSYMTNLTISRIRTFNVNYWGIYVGSLDGLDTSIRNKSVIVEDCVLEGENLTFEGLLVFNSSNFIARRNKFTGGPTAPGLGIYQNVDTILVDSNSFSNLSVPS